MKMITGALLILTSAVLMSARSNWVATIRTGPGVGRASFTVFGSDDQVFYLMEWLAILSFVSGTVLLIWGLVTDKKAGEPATK